MAAGRANSSHGDTAAMCRQDQSFSLEAPPFGVGSHRFSKQSACGPAYHAAYGELTSAPRWDVKGWAALDDPIRRGRGTCGGLQHSSMAAPSGPPASGSSLQPMFATHPNETRLKELLDLQRRRTQAMPPPGSYELPGWNNGRTTFRRPAVQALDGPFPAASTEDTTRVREMAASLLVQTAAQMLGPGEYDVLRSKGASSSVRSTPAHRISQSTREGRTPHLKSLSVSRSLQHGIDWHVPVIVQVRKSHPTTQLGIKQQAPHHGAAAVLPTDADMQGTSQGQLRHRQDQATAPRYMAASPTQQVDLSNPPAAPIHIARNIPKQLAHQPGAWNWNTLNYNYRNNWTTLHGGPYLQGYKKHLRRAATAPAGSHHQSRQQAVSDMQEQLHGIFSITEESSTPADGRLTEHSQTGNIDTYDSNGAGAQQQAAHDMELQSAKVRPTHQDIQRHAEAVQAANSVQQLAARRTKWASQSGQGATLT